MQLESIQNLAPEALGYEDSDLVTRLVFFWDSMLPHHARCFGGFDATCGGFP